MASKERCVTRTNSAAVSSTHHYWQVLDRRVEKTYTELKQAGYYPRSYTVRRYTIFYCVYCTAERLVDDPALS